MFQFQSSKYKSIILNFIAPAYTEYTQRYFSDDAPNYDAIILKFVVAACIG